MISVERIALEILRDAAAVTAIVGAGGVVTELPEGVGRPVIRVEASGGEGGASSGPVWLDRPTVQVDAWGDTKEDAESAIRAAADAFVSAPRTNPVLTDGTVTRVTTTYPVWNPDEDWPGPDGQPGPRYTMTVRIAGHPNP